MGIVRDWIQGVKQILFKDARGGFAPAMVLMDSDGTLMDLSASGTLISQSAGVIYTETTPLGVSGTWVSDVINIKNYGICYVVTYSDVASATDGLLIEQSHDGVTWGRHDDKYTVSAGGGRNDSINPHSNYLRVTYTNGPVAQTEFTLQIKLNVGGLASSHRIKDNVSGENDSELMTSVIKSDSGDGTTYKNIDAQHPLPMDSDSLYEKDIDRDRSTSANFTGGTVIDLFNDRHSTLVNETTENPKTIYIEFKRPLQTNILGIDAATGTFSNAKITGRLGLGADRTSVVLVDESDVDTPKTLLVPQIEPATISAIDIEFYTTGTCSISTFASTKALQRISRQQALTDAGNVVDISATNEGNLKMSIQEYGDTPSIDAFDRLRVSQPFTLFDSKQIHDNQPLFWDEENGGIASGTYNQANASVEMNVSASASDYCIRQTKQRLNYQPGKGQLAFLTFLAPRESGVTKRMGLFTNVTGSFMTPDNGIFFEVSGSHASWSIAKNGVVAENAPQNDWNVDTLDASGTSAIELDLNDSQIGIIDYEWLGVGRVRVGFVIDGIIRYCHYFNHANTGYSSVYMSTPNLPIRYDIQSDGGGAGQLDHICATVMSEGGVEETGILRAVDTGSTHVDADAANTTYAVVGIRLKSTHLDVTVIPEFFSMINEVGDDFRWSLLLNPTIAGTFAYSDVENSAIQKATGATANTVSDEDIIIDSGYVVAGFNAGGGDGRKFSTSLRMGSKVDGDGDEVVLCVTPLTAGADIQGSLTFREML